MACDKKMPDPIIDRSSFDSIVSSVTEVLGNEQSAISNFKTELGNLSTFISDFANDIKQMNDGMRESGINLGTKNSGFGQAVLQLDANMYNGDLDNFLETITTAIEERAQLIDGYVELVSEKKEYVKDAVTNAESVAASAGDHFGTESWDTGETDDEGNSILDSREVHYPSYDDAVDKVIEEQGHVTEAAEEVKNIME